MPLVERAHAEKRMHLERTIDHFHRDYDYARAHPENPFSAPHPESPFGSDPIEFYQGLTEEIGPAFGNRWRAWRFRWSRGNYDHPSSGPTTTGHGDLTNVSERKLMDCTWLRHRNHREAGHQFGRALDGHQR